MRRLVLPFALVASLAPANAQEPAVERAEAARALHASRLLAEDSLTHVSEGEKDRLPRAIETAAALLKEAERFEKANDALSQSLLAPGVPPAAAQRHDAFLSAHRARRLELAKAVEGLSGKDPVKAAKQALSILEDASPLPPRDSKKAIEVRHVRRLDPRDARSTYREFDEVLLGEKPVPQDLAKPHASIETAARGLAKTATPAQVAAWVRSSIAPAPYHGEALGAAGCLRDRRCGAFDAASLLAGLLRARGTHARLAYGTVEADARFVAARLLGGGGAQEALDALILGGVPAIAAGERVRFEHVWVRAYVRKGPERERADAAWVDLDPVFDTAARVVPAAEETAPAAKEVDAAAMLARYLADPADRTPFGADFLPPPAPAPTPRKPSRKAPKKGAKGSAAKGKPVPAPAPSVAAFRIAHRAVEIASVPAAYKSYVALAIGGTVEKPVADLRLPLADVVESGILLYPASTSDLERKIAKALGGSDRVPPHLTTATTLVALGGKEVGALPPTAWGQPLPVFLTLVPPNGDPVDVTGIVQTGAPAAITVVPYEPGGGWLPARWRAADADPTGPAGLARFCAATGAQFFADLLDETERLAARAGGRRFVSPSTVLVAGALHAPSGLARAPLFSDPAGITVDVGRLDELLLPAPGADAVSFEVAAGAALSAWEARALEIATGFRAVSTITAAKASARDGGAPKIFRSRPAASELALLSPAARTDLEAGFEEGYVALIPRTPQSLEDWVGESYVILDPRSGRGAYLVRGGLRGAVTADRADEVLARIRDGGDPGPILGAWRRGRASRSLLAREGWPVGKAPARATGVDALLRAAATREAVPAPEISPWPPAGGKAKALELGSPIAVSRTGTLLWMGRASRVLDPVAAKSLPKNATGYDPKTRMWIGPTALGIAPVGKEGRLLPLPARY